MHSTPEPSTRPRPRPPRETAVRHPTPRVVFFDAEGTLWVPRPGRTLHEFWDCPTLEHARLVFRAAPGIHAALARLVASGCRLVVLSRHDACLLPTLLEEFKVAVYFEDVLVNGDKGERAAKWLQEQGVAHEDALMVGDRMDLDIEPLRRVQIPACLVDRPYNRHVDAPRLRGWDELVEGVEQGSETGFPGAFASRWAKADGSSGDRFDFR